mgnify:CR=1 FL=1
MLVFRRKLKGNGSAQYYALGRVYPRIFLRQEQVRKASVLEFIVVSGEDAGEATLSCVSSLTAEAEGLRDVTLDLIDIATVTAESEVEITTTVDLNDIATLSGEATLEIEATADLTNTCTLLADATVLTHDIAGEATLTCSSLLTATGSVQESSRSTGNRVDWENTLGAAPGPIFGWAGGMGSLPPAIAIRFICGKHIYSDVKRKNRDIEVTCLNVTQVQKAKTQVNLVKMSKKTNKARFKMKENHGKIHALEE